MDQLVISSRPLTCDEQAAFRFELALFSMPAHLRAPVEPGATPTGPAIDSSGWTFVPDDPMRQLDDIERWLTRKQQEFRAAGIATDQVDYLLGVVAGRRMTLTDIAAAALEDRDRAAKTRRTKASRKKKAPTEKLVVVELCDRLADWFVPRLLQERLTAYVEQLKKRDLEEVERSGEYP